MSDLLALVPRCYFQTILSFHSSSDFFFPILVCSPSLAFIEITLLSLCLLFFSVELRGSRTEPAFPDQRGNQGHHLRRHHADLHPCLFHPNLPAAPLYTQLLRADRVGPCRSDPHRPRPWISSASAWTQLCYHFSGYPLCWATIREAPIPPAWAKASVDGTIRGQFLPQRLLPVCWYFISRLPGQRDVEP